MCSRLTEFAQFGKDLKGNYNTFKVDNAKRKPRVLDCQPSTEIIDTYLVETRKQIYSDTSSILNHELMSFHVTIFWT